MIVRRAAIALAAAGALAISGCSSGIDATYGRSRDWSVNGTGLAAEELLRERGNEVKATLRLTDDLAEWADVIVRFAPYPGPPDSDEAAWYGEWLDARSGRRLIYVPRDYDAVADYWSHVLDGLPKGRDPDREEQARTLRDKAWGWANDLPARSKTPADPLGWFAVVDSTIGPEVCSTLEGPWARGVDPAAAAVSRHTTLKVESETVLLSGDGLPLAIEWTRYAGSRVLAVANGSFLLNAALLDRARRPLAMRVVGWAGDEPGRVAFVEGRNVTKEAAEESIFALLKVPPFGWVAGQMLVLGLAACLAAAPRLGRARPEPPSGEDRPVAHPEALGALLARSGQAADARAILEVYRRWRHPARPGHPMPADGHPSPPRVNHE